MSARKIEKLESKLRNATFHPSSPSQPAVGLFSEKEIARLRQRPPKILVVDDKLDTLLLLRELLKCKCYEMLSGGDAGVEEDQMQSERLVLMLLHGIMPGKYGYEI